MNDSQIPPGHVLMRLDDLAELLAGRPAASPPPTPVAATWQALAVLIGLLTARLGGVTVDHGAVRGDVPPEAIAGTAIMLAGSLLSVMPSDVAAELLRELGLAALNHETDTTGGTF